MDHSLLVSRQPEPSPSSVGPSAHFSDNALTHPVHLPGGKKNRVALLWGLASAILSGLGFIALALFEQYNGMVSELRTDLKHFNETQGNFVKRESYEKFRDKLRETYRELHEAKIVRTQMEQELKVSEKARAEVQQELQKIREKLAYIEGRQTTLAPRLEPTPPTGN